MNFWESEVGEITGSAADAFVKSFKQIPDGTMALARIETFTNVAYHGSKYLSIDWILIAGDFKGQKVNQKLKVFGDAMSKDSSKTRYRALNMLRLLYQLFSLKPKSNEAPSDQDLTVFIGQEAGLKIRETEPNDQGRQYNWVSEVHGKNGFQCETGVSLVVTHVNPKSSVTRNSPISMPQDFTQIDLDDIPF